MKITTVKELVAMKKVIGAQNVTAGKKLLADGGVMWVFQSLKEIGADPELTDKEKADCRTRFRREKLGWTGYFRTPPRRPVPGFTPSPRCDSHGNSRGGGSGGGHDSIH